MKKLKVLVAAVCLVLISNVSQAQTKIGYIDAETVLYLMPEVSKIDSMMRLYQVDSIGREYTSLMQTYQYKDSVFRDSAHPLPPAVKEQYQKDLFQLTQTLQGWQEIAQQAYQNKQNQLLAPVMRKINDAINAVAKEKGYTHVLSRETLLVAPEADNLLQSVAKKLNVTVPPQLLPGYKPAPGVR
ncbi:MAG: OmpH family outer membrane protein [Chitinophagaceae bacterium]|nr:MAG: OmpH family outer membrane protein [Chitinophagaceae bacterium]